MTANLRIVADGPSSTNAHVYLLNEDDSETELCGVTKAVVTLDVGHVNRATLELVAVNAEMDAQLEHIVVQVLPPERGREVVQQLADALGLDLVAGPRIPSPQESE